MANEIIEEPKAETSLVAFDEIKAEIAKCKIANKELEFNYLDPKGNMEARSHVHSLRKAKTTVTKVHKITKAEPWAACQAIDKQKRDLHDDLDEMIEVHAEPLRKIEQEAEAKIQKEIEDKRIEDERIEREKQESMQKQQEELDRKEAELKAEQAKAVQDELDRQDKIEREDAEREARLQAEKDTQLAIIKAEQDKIDRDRAKLVAEQQAEKDAAERVVQAKKQAEIDKQAALDKVEQEKQDAIDKLQREKDEAVEAEKEKARKIEADRVASVEAVKAEQSRLDKIKADRIADENHRAKVEAVVSEQIGDLIGDIHEARGIVAALVAGAIKHVTINY